MTVGGKADGAPIPHPGGLEGLGPLAEVLEADNLAVPESRHLVVHLFVDLNPAQLAPTVVAQPGRDAVTGINVFLRAQLQLVERLVQPFPEAPDLVRAAARV